MRLHNKSILTILLLVLLVCAAGAGFASNADTWLIEGDWAVRAAQKKDIRTTDRNDLYAIALRVYEKVQSKYPDTPEGALALYKIAEMTYRGEGEARNLRAAHEALKRLIALYDGIKTDDLTVPEVEQIRGIVAQGKKLDAEIRDLLDKENSQKTLYKIMDALVKATGSRRGFSYWFAIILLTVILKIVTAPLTKAQFRSMKEMQTIAPKVKEIQEKHKGDQATIGQKTMELYKEHHINPFASCLPILIQMPILWMMFLMMQQYEFQLQHGTFAWIGSALSHLTYVPVPSFFGSMGGPVWVTARNLAEPDLILVVLYLISMYISTKMSAVDPTQAEQQKMMAIMMPLMFGIIFATYPSAFLLYWLTLNILQTVQQYYILHKPVQVAETPVIEQVEPPKPDEGGIPRGQRSSRRRRRR